MNSRVCARCGREQPATAEGKFCLYCGAELSITVAPEATPQQATAPIAPPTEAATLPEGKRRCANCGEELYAIEARCWRCGASQEAAAPSPVAPAAPPPFEAPQATLPPPVQGPIYCPQPTMPAPLDPVAASYGTWALVLGIVGLFCPGLVSIVAIFLGVRANRGGATGTGTAGVILGVIGLLFFIIIGIVGYVVYFIVKIS